MAKIEILNHATARADVSEQMRKLANNLKDRAVVHENTTYPLPLVSSDTEIVVVNAGDGIKSAAVQAYPEQLLVVVPGGSKNAIDALLSEEGVTITSDQLLELDTESIPLYHPLEVNGERAMIFIGLDDIAKRFFTHNEQLRALFPTNLRTPRHTIAQIRAFVDAVVHDPMNPALRLFTIDPHMSQLPKFTEQKVYGDGKNVSMFSVTGKTKAERVGKVALLFTTGPYFMRMGISVPSWLATMDTQPSFTIFDAKREHTRGNFDGEEKEFPHEGTIFVQRSDERYARRMAALVV